MRGTRLHARIKDPAVWLLALALAVFAVPLTRHTCLQAQEAEGSCCASADATSCCADEASAEADIPVCCLEVAETPDAMPLPVRELVHAATGPALAVTGQPTLLAPPSATPCPAATTPPAAHAKRHAVLCLMLI